VNCNFNCFPYLANSCSCGCRKMRTKVPIRTSRLASGACTQCTVWSKRNCSARPARRAIWNRLINIWPRCASLAPSWPKRRVRNLPPSRPPPTNQIGTTAIPESGPFSTYWTVLNWKTNNSNSRRSVLFSAFVASQVRPPNIMFQLTTNYWSIFSYWHASNLFQNVFMLYLAFLGAIPCLFWGTHNYYHLKFK